MPELASDFAASQSQSLDVVSATGISSAIHPVHPAPVVTTTTRRSFITMTYSGAIVSFRQVLREEASKLVDLQTVMLRSMHLYIIFCLPTFKF